MTCMALQQALLVKVDCRTMSRFSAILVLKHGTFSSSQLVLKSADAGRGTATREAETRDKPLSPQSAAGFGDLKEPVFLSALPDELGQTVVGSQFRRDL